MSTTIDEARSLVETRLSELDQERDRLSRALAELRGNARTDRAAPRRVGRPKGSKSKTRRKRTGTRSDEAVALIAASPGIGGTEIARKMGIKPNYMYRVLKDLEKAGAVKKDGRKYFPVGQ